MLCSLDQYKTLIGSVVSNSVSDAQLTALLTAADKAVKKYCKQQLESANYVQYYNGNNTQMLILKQTPVSAINNVWLDNSGYFGSRVDSFSGPSLLESGIDYILDTDQDLSISRSGILYRIGTVWPVVTRVSRLGRLSPDQGPAWGNVKVDYVAGYATVPEDLQLATALLVSVMKRTVAIGQPLESERMGSYAYKLLHSNEKHNPDLTTAVQLLASYRDTVW